MLYLLLVQVGEVLRRQRNPHYCFQLLGFKLAASKDLRHLIASKIFVTRRLSHGRNGVMVDPVSPFRVRVT